MQDKMSFTPPEKYSELELVGYLFNRCYGGYTVSQAFLDRLNEIRREAGLEPKEAHELEHHSMRFDPLVVKTFQELGSEKASGVYARIHIKWFPRSFLNYLNWKETDGKESINIDVPRALARILEDFLREWKENPSLQVEELNTRYVEFQKKISLYSDFCFDYR